MEEYWAPDEVWRKNWVEDTWWEPSAGRMLKKTDLIFELAASFIDPHLWQKKISQYYESRRTRWLIFWELFC